MAHVDPVRIDGLRDFQKALRAMDDGLQKELRGVMNQAAEIVADDARRHVPVRSGKARASVRVSSQQRFARVSGGSARVPYYGWLDYGGTVGRGRVPGGAKKKAEVAGNVQRPFLPQGRYLYPAYHRHQDEITEVLTGALVDLARKAGLDVERGA